jgi:hypothetical protein
MKKVFTLIAFFVFLLNYSNGQVRITEVQPMAPTSSTPNYFELFYKTASISNDDQVLLDDYVVLVFYRNSNGVQKIRYAKFRNGLSVFGSDADYNSTNAPGLNASEYTDGTVLFTSSNFSFSSQGNSYTYPNQQNITTNNVFEGNSIYEQTVNSNNQYNPQQTVTTLFDPNLSSKSGEEFAIFLFKNGKPEDFVTTTRSYINSLPTLFLQGQTIIFSSINITSEKVGPSIGGANNTFDLVRNTARLAPECAFRWNKDNGNPLFFNDPGQLNFPYWAWETYWYRDPLKKLDEIVALETNIPNTSGSILSVNRSNNSASIEIFEKISNLTQASISDLYLELFYTNQLAADVALPFSVNGNSYTSTAVNLEYLDVINSLIKINFIAPGYRDLNSGEIIIYPLKLNIKHKTNVCFSATENIRVVNLAALPASIGYISLKSVNTANKISWNTSSESNNKGFEVQRSMGNTNDFKTIGFVGTKAKQGNSQSEIGYSFEDADVKPGQTHYYRLNQIDFDGKSAFSPVKSIKPGSIESNLSVYPNPNQGSFTVNTGSTSGKLNIFVMDNTGRVVNQYMNVSTTNTRINNLKKGFYTLKIVNTESGEQSAQRVVVQ